MNVMEYAIGPISNEDRTSVIDIFNYYVEHSFAAYPDKRLPYEAFDRFLQMSGGFPTGTIRDRNGMVAGFGMLKAHSAMSVFSRTVEWSCFIHPDHTGKGLGRKLLDYLEKGAVEQGITSILASISSLNTGSIAFHERNGFTACGLFRKVGQKHGQEFDTVWMQKMLR